MKVTPNKMGFISTESPYLSPGVDLNFKLTRQKVFVHKNRVSLQLLILYEMLKERCEEVNVIR